MASRSDWVGFAGWDDGFVRLKIALLNFQYTRIDLLSLRSERSIEVWDHGVGACEICDVCSLSRDPMVLYKLTRSALSLKSKSAPSVLPKDSSKKIMCSFALSRKFF